MTGVSFRSSMPTVAERRLFCVMKRGLRASCRGNDFNGATELIRKGREAEALIIEEHLPLVDEIANRMFQKNKLFLVDVDDLISAGVEGLLTAMHRFRGARLSRRLPAPKHLPRQHVRFATYAAWWIRAEVSKAVRDHRWMVGIPSHTYQRVLKVLRAMYELEIELQRPPTGQELSTRLNLPEKTLRQLVAWISPQCISLETPVGQDGESVLGDFIEDRTISPPNMSAELTVLHEGFGRILATLPERERLVIEGRFGLDHRGQRTQEELATQFSLTRQAIGAIEERAISRMRSEMGVRDGQSQPDRWSKAMPNHRAKRALRNLKTSGGNGARRCP